MQKNASIEMATRKNLFPSNLVVFIVILIFTSILILQPFLPDYETYREIYESGGGHLEVFGRDPGFVFIVQSINQIFSYEQFRAIILSLIAVLTLCVLNTLQVLSKNIFGATVIFAFIPLFFLKFGIQIREGIAIAIWFFALFGTRCRWGQLSFALMAILSSSIHMATAPLWLVLFLGFYFDRIPRISFFIAIVLYAIFIHAVVNPSRLESEQFSGLNKEWVTLTLPQVIYWLSYFGFFLIFLFESNPYKNENLENHKSIKALGFVIRAGVIGLLAGIAGQLFINGFEILQKGLIADILRIASLLLILGCIFLAITGKKKQAALFGLFALIDVIRIILAA